MDLQQMIHSEILRLAKEDKLQEVVALLTAGNLGVFVQNMPADPSTEAKQDALAALVGAVDAAAVTDPTASAAAIALLKGLIKQLQGDGDKENAFQLTGRYEVQDAVIAAAGTVSTEIDFRAYKYLSFLMPAAWTAATLTLKGSAVTGGTKVAIKNDTNTTFPAMTVAVDTIYSVDVNALMAAGVHFLALESSVAQVAERTIKVMCKA